MNELRISTKAQAESFFAEFVEDLVIPFQVGWQGWLSLGTEGCATLSERTRANIVYDYMKREVKHRFGDNKKSGVTVIEKSGLVFLNFADEACLRFKKYDKKRRPQNVRTKQQKRLAEQQLPLGFSADPTVITIGYRLNGTQTEIKDIAMTCWLSETRKAWTYVVCEEATRQLSLPDFEDQTSPAMPPKPATPAVTPKRKTDGREKKDA